MIDILKNSYLIYGSIVLAAAVQGAAKGSPPSILAGGILGVLIVAGGAFLGKAEPKVTVGLVFGLIGALGVAGKFLPDFFKKGHALWPAGVLGFLAVATVLLTIVGFVKK